MAPKSFGPVKAKTAGGEVLGHRRLERPCDTAWRPRVLAQLKQKQLEEKSSAIAGLNVHVTLHGAQEFWPVKAKTAAGEVLGHRRLERPCDTAWRPRVLGQLKQKQLEEKSSAIAGLNVHVTLHGAQEFWPS